MMAWSLQQALRAALTLGIAIGLAASSGCGAAPRASGDPPDRIVLIVIDTLRRDHLSVYGARFSTPNIDALARSGQVFERASASFHQTTMSMGALFTGRTPSIESGDPANPLHWNGSTWCGLWRFSTGTDECVPSSLQTLAEAVRDVGYWTAGVTTNPLLFRPAGFDRGFDHWVEVGQDSVEVPVHGRVAMLLEGSTASDANQAVAQALDGRPHDRFFLYVHYIDVHEYGRAYRRGYPAAVRAADAGVGQLLAELEKRGLRDGTTVVLVSDHGERLRERHLLKGRPRHVGNPSFEEHLAVPLIVSPPSEVDSATPLRSDGVHDLLREIAGARRVSADDLERDELFLSEHRFQTYRKGRWKLYRLRSNGESQLVDLQQDPGETRDVSEQHPEVSLSLRRRVDELTRSLAGAEPEPSTLNDRDRRRLEVLGYLE